MKIYLSTITYDITPPTLAVIADIGKFSTTLANTSVQTPTQASAQTDTPSASTAQHQRSGRRLQYFTPQGREPSSSTQLQRSSRQLQYYTLQATDSSSSSALMYGTNVVFNFSEPVQGFAKEYAFIKGGALSSNGLNETVSQQQYTATVVSDSTDQPLLMVTGSKLLLICHFVCKAHCAVMRSPLAAVRHYCSVNLDHSAFADADRT